MKISHESFIKIYYNDVCYVDLAKRCLIKM